VQPGAFDFSGEGKVGKAVCGQQYGSGSKPACKHSRLLSSFRLPLIAGQEAVGGTKTPKNEFLRRGSSVTNASLFASSV